MARNWTWVPDLIIEILHGKWVLIVWRETSSVIYNKPKVDRLMWGLAYFVRWLYYSFNSTLLRRNIKIKIGKFLSCLSSNWMHCVNPIKQDVIGVTQVKTFPNHINVTDSEPVGLVFTLIQYELHPLASSKVPLWDSISKWEPLINLLGSKSPFYQSKCCLCW